jgi:hypothetical protein
MEKKMFYVVAGGVLAYLVYYLYFRNTNVQKYIPDVLIDDSPCPDGEFLQTVNCITAPCPKECVKKPDWADTFYTGLPASCCS